ncbi:MAG TPA: response regulator, partial [Bryobacteraceae bacterium]|nr:response regulator [Bryobacteraceae bacterium]
SGIVGHGGPIEVLIADDDSDVRETLRLALASEGMQCLEAADGLAALSLARDRSPIAAVLDVEMPGLNGYDVVQALRLDRSPLGILLLTGERQQGEVLRGFDSGADDYLIKPFSSLELATRVKRTALAGSRRTAAISRPPR